MINKFTNNLDDTPLHSSSYADVASVGGFGSVTPQTFSQRMHIENNRTSVGKYRNSMLGHGNHRNSHYQRVDIVNASTRPGVESNVAARGATTPLRPTGRAISDIAQAPPRRNFTEPSTRGYNPYK